MRKIYRQGDVMLIRTDIVPELDGKTHSSIEGKEENNTIILGDSDEFWIKFWIHYQIVTNSEVPDHKKENFFGCIC